MSAENPRYAYFRRDECCGEWQEFWLAEPDCFGIDLLPSTCGTCHRGLWFRLEEPPAAMTYTVKM